MSLKYSPDELYVVADFGYHGQPGTDGYVYTSKETAQASIDDLAAAFQARGMSNSIKYRIMDLQEYIWSNRDYEKHSCEIC